MFTHPITQCSDMMQRYLFKMKVEVMGGWGTHHNILNVIRQLKQSRITKNFIADCEKIIEISSAYYLTLRYYVDHRQVMFVCVSSNSGCVTSRTKLEVRVPRISSGEFRVNK